MAGPISRQLVIRVGGGACATWVAAVKLYQTHCLWCFVSAYLFCIGALVLVWLDRRSSGKLATE
jgi:hypothetical protein